MKWPFSIAINRAGSCSETLEKFIFRVNGEWVGLSTLKGSQPSWCKLKHSEEPEENLYRDSEQALREW